MSQGCTNLWKVVKQLCILSHGNAAPESGFSINEDLLEENLRETSLVSLRVVYDAIIDAGGPLDIEASDELLNSY